MSADENVSKYQFHWVQDPHIDTHGDYFVYQGDMRVADMGVRKWRNEHTVTTLYADQAHRHVVPTLLGLAANRAQAEGVKLTPSHGLSRYSSGLVQNLQSRGLVTKSDSFPTTDYSTDFRDSEAVYAPERQGVRLTTGTVNQGRKTIRRLLRGSAEGG